MSDESIDSSNGESSRKPTIEVIEHDSMHIDMTNIMYKAQLNALNINNENPDIALAQYKKIISLYGFTNRLPGNYELLRKIYDSQFLHDMFYLTKDRMIQTIQQASSDMKRKMQLQILMELDPKFKESDKLYTQLIEKYKIKDDTSLEEATNMIAIANEWSDVIKQQHCKSMINEFELDECVEITNSVQVITRMPPERIQKLSYKTVEAIIRKIYSDQQTMRSTALDILAIYLKCQKLLYTESKTLCEQRLYALMLPAILVSAVCTFLSLQLKDDPNGGFIVSVLNAFNSFLLAVVTYLKLDAKAEAHKSSAYKYDKLQSYCEFNSGKTLFFEDKKDVLKIIEEVETKVGEIKETNQFIIPEHIRYTFKDLYGNNVFATAKAVQYKEMKLINKLKGVINTLLEVHESNNKDKEEEIIRLERNQNALINDIIELRNEYSLLDSGVNNAIAVHIRNSKNRWWKCMDWLKT